MNDCFFITPIGYAGSAERRRSDRVAAACSQALEHYDYRLIRADQISKLGHITDQVISMCCKCPLAISDLTGLNANVMYETALRHASGLPTILIMDSDGKGIKLPFDIGDVRAIEYKLSARGWADKLKKDLYFYIESALSPRLKPATTTGRIFHELYDSRIISYKGLEAIPINVSHTVLDHVVGNDFVAWNPSWQTELDTNPDAWIEVHSRRYTSNLLKRARYVVGRSSTHPTDDSKYFGCEGLAQFLNLMRRECQEAYKSLNQIMQIHLVDRLDSDLTYFIGNKLVAGSPHPIAFGAIIINESPLLNSVTPTYMFETRQPDLVDLLTYHSRTIIGDKSAEVLSPENFLETCGSIIHDGNG